MWRLVATILALITCLYVSLVQTSGVDFWLQAKIGEIIVQQHAIPDTLLFPFTEIATEKFNAHEWLASIVFYAAIQLVGEDGLPFFTALLGLSLFLLAAWLCFVRSQRNLAVALFGAAIALAGENYRHVLRPELLALNLMVAYWIGLERFRACPGYRNALWPAVCVLLWVNSHGSFIIAPILAGIYTLGLHVDRMRQQGAWKLAPSPAVRAWALLTLAMSLACLVNPFGWEMVHFVFDFSSKAGLATRVYEWMPSYKFTYLPGFWIAAGIWCLILLVVLMTRKSISAVDVLACLFFSVLAVKAIRFPVYLGLLAAFVLSGAVAQKWKQAPAQERLYQLFSVLMALVLAAVANFGNAQGMQPSSLGVVKLSRQMVKELGRPDLQGNVLTSMQMGAELIYRAYPRLKPSIDCRVDSYGMDYMDFQDTLFFNDKLFDEFVQRYDVKYMLIDRARFVHFMERDAWKSKHWELIMLDQSAALLQRAAP
jgi:hypothetical protein